MKVQTCLLASYPTGQLSADNFRFEESQELDASSCSSLQDGQILVKLLYISVDPYMRGRFASKAGPGYMSGFEIGKPIESFCVAEIIESKNEKFVANNKGSPSLVSGMLPWITQQVVADPASATLNPLPKIDGVPPSYFLGVLGTTGLSAYLPFQKLAKDFLVEKKKASGGSAPPVVFVSGAAGAVGSTFAQLCKNAGCKVYGSAGTEEKVNLCKSTFGFDGAFNYKHVSTIGEGLDTVLQGQTIDLYFDNVGGPMLDAVLERMSMGGKIVCCGSISQYDTSEKYGVKNIFAITTKCLTVQGFLLFQWADEMPQATMELAKLLQENKLVSKETVLKGFEKVVDGMLGLLQGTNVGKMVIEV